MTNKLTVKEWLKYGYIDGWLDAYEREHPTHTFVKGTEVDFHYMGYSINIYYHKDKTGIIWRVRYANSFGPDLCYTKENAPPEVLAYNTKDFDEMKSILKAQPTKGAWEHIKEEDIHPHYATWEDNQFGYSSRNNTLLLLT